MTRARGPILTLLSMLGLAMALVVVNNATTLDAPAPPAPAAVAAPAPDPPPPAPAVPEPAAGFPSTAKYVVTGKGGARMTRKLDGDAVTGTVDLPGYPQWAFSAAPADTPPAP